MTAEPLPGYEHLYSGKVRDLYAPLGPTGRPVDDRLLLVASDRISAYDWVLDTPIPDKGSVLTRLSLWWFNQLADLVPNHVVSTDVPDAVSGRAVLVRRLEMLKVEAVARAYLPEGLIDGSRLSEPVFTPSTKAPLGEHDQPMTPDQVEAEIGADLAAEVSEITCAILARGNEVAAERGILIADTKVEFGLAPGDRGARGGLVLADEVLTPDSSRFWPAAAWRPGRVQPSYDKQFVRDWLTSPESGWSRTSGEAPPPLPEQVVAETRAKYVEVFELLTGETF